MKEKNTSSGRFLPVIVAAVVFVVLTGAFAFFESRIYHKSQEKYQYMAANQAHLISGAMDTVMARVYALRAMVVASGGSLESFDGMAAEIYAETEADTGLCVKNFILAPDGVVEKIYPAEGNEGLLGLDYMDASLEGNAEAIEACRENRLILTEPFHLTQGGTGIAGRLPVYLEDADENETFWGLVSVTLDVDELKESFNLDYLEKSGIRYSLWYTDSDGEKTVIDASDTKPAHPVSADISIVNLNWTLDIAPKDGWVSAFEVAAGLAVILLISLLCLRILQSGIKVRNMNDKLEELAVRDNLTGCFSRHYLNEELLLHDSGEWRDSTADYSLAMVDVDSFKQVNDLYGHDIGDRALLAVASVLRGLCDELRGDCVIRCGGDEFVFLMNHAYPDLFESRLQSIVERVRSIRIEGAPDMRLTVSVGAVPADGSCNYYEMFSLADKEVYEAKRNGKDRYSIRKTDSSETGEKADQ